MHISKSLLLAIGLSVAIGGICRAGTDPVQLYTEALKTLATGCQLDYVSTVIAPDGTTTKLAGSLAIRGEQYFDSSNARFVLVNDRWVVTADHEAQEVSVLYLPIWKGKYGQAAELVTSGFLLSDPGILRTASVRVSESGKDTISIHLQYADPATPLRSLTLQYRRGNLIPVRYWGTVWLFPESDEDGIGEAPAPNDAAVLQFTCFNIRKDVSATVFDERRVLDHRGGKATLKRYNHYKMFRTGATAGR